MMFDALGRRATRLGLLSRDFLGRSFSDSEAEEEVDDDDECAFAEATGLGVGGVAMTEGPTDAMMPVR